MKEELKKIMLAGIGSIVYAYEKAFELLDIFIEKGESTIRNKNIFCEELERFVKPEAAGINNTPSGSIDSAKSNNYYITQKEFNELKSKLDKIESLLKNK